MTVRLTLPFSQFCITFTQLPMISSPRGVAISAGVELVDASTFWSGVEVLWFIFIDTLRSCLAVV